MEKLIFLVVLLAALANCEISFTINLFKENANMTCSGEGTLSNYTKAVSIVITRSSSDNSPYLASRSSYITTNNFTKAQRSSPRNNSLSLVWFPPYTTMEGTYTCTFYYLAEDNTPSSVSEQITVELQDMDPIITTSPKHIQDGLTKSLVLECSTISLGLHGLSLPAQIEIFHIYDGKEQRIASLANNSGKSESTAENGWNVVSSNIAKNLAVSLSVIRGLPTTAESGTYKCVISGTSNTNDNVQIVKTVQIQASVATKEEIYDRTGQEDQTDNYLFTCNFENGLCGFDLGESQFVTAWQHVQSRLVGYVPDHTLANKMGHFMKVYFPPGAYSSRQTASLKSKKFRPKVKSLCVSFWYYMIGHKSELLVYIGMNPSFQEYKLAETRGWTYSEMPVQVISEDFIVEIHFRHNYDFYYGYSQEATAGIDDFVVSDINCAIRT